MSQNKSKVIAVYSPSGGGKTTVTRELNTRVPNSAALYFDDRDYDSDSGIIDICQWYDEGADVNLFDLQLLANDIDALLNEKVDYIFLDYPFGYRHNLISKYLNFSIFINTPLDIALARRLLRDFKNGTAKAILNDIDFYLKRGRTLYIYGNKTAREEADFIVDGSLPLNEIIEKIHEKIREL